MDTRPEDALNDLERRLSGWMPSASTPSRDRLLFEAGRASEQAGARGRSTTAILAALVLGLGGWAVGEHNQRKALELTLAGRTSAPNVALAGQPTPPASASVPAAAPSPESYLAMSRRIASAGPEDRWSSLASPADEPHPAGPGRSITPLNARRPGGLVDL